MHDPIAEFKALRDILRDEQSELLQNGIEIGDFTYGIPAVESLEEGATLQIGKFCSISHDVTIMLGGNHRPDWNSTYPFNVFMPSFSFIEGHPATKGDVKIGNDVWIASGVKIMSGVTIADGCVIGANALVTKSIEPYSIVGGVPAKLIKKRFEQETIEKLCEMQWWDWQDEQIVRAISFLQSSNIDGLYNYYLNCVKENRSV